MSDGYGPESDKPFLCFRSGRFAFRIVPRNAEGWRLLGMWIGGLLVLTGLHVWFNAGDPPENLRIAVTVGFVLVTIGWAVAMVRWMLPRSEVIDMSDLADFKAELRRKRERDRN